MASVTIWKKSNDQSDLRIGRTDRGSHIHISSHGCPQQRCRGTARHDPDPYHRGLCAGSERRRVCLGSLCCSSLHARHQQLIRTKSRAGRPRQPDHALVEANARFETEKSALQEEGMSTSQYYVVGNNDVWMIQFKDTENGQYKSSNEAISFAIATAQKLGVRGECAHVCVLDGDGRLRCKWSYYREIVTCARVA